MQSLGARLLVKNFDKPAQQHIFRLLPGNEQPPHPHSREGEFYYVLEGEFDVYVEEEILKVEAGLGLPDVLCQLSSFSSATRRLTFAFFCSRSVGRFA
jgi:CRP-like cAMP-binding protein